MNARSFGTDRGVVLRRFCTALGTAVILLAGAGMSLPAQAAALTSFENLTPVSETELAEMRGGFVLPNGMVVNVSLEFHTVVSDASGSGVPLAQEDFSFDETTLVGSGVVYTVTVDPGDGTPAIEITPQMTTDITGVVTVIQNNVSEIAIMNTATLNLDLLNAAVAQRLFQSHSFTMQMRTLGVLGL